MLWGAIQVRKWDTARHWPTGFNFLGKAGVKQVHFLNFALSNHSRQAEGKGMFLFRMVFKCVSFEKKLIFSRIFSIAVWIRPAERAKNLLFFAVKIKRLFCLKFKSLSPNIVLVIGSIVYLWLAAGLIFLHFLMSVNNDLVGLHVSF